MTKPIDWSAPLEAETIEVLEVLATDITWPAPIAVKIKTDRGEVIITGYERDGAHFLGNPGWHIRNAPVRHPGGWLVRFRCGVARGSKWFQTKGEALGYAAHARRHNLAIVRLPDWCEGDGLEMLEEDAGQKEPPDA